MSECGVKHRCLWVVQRLWMQAVYKNRDVWVTDGSARQTLRFFDLFDKPHSAAATQCGHGTEQGTAEKLGSANDRGLDRIS